jgi:hypothetical protein
MSRLVVLVAALSLVLACTSTAPAADLPTDAPTSPPPSPTPTTQPNDPPTPSPSPSPTATARPTASPTPTAPPMMSEEELAQVFLLMADRLNAGICAENAIIESASDRELYDVAIASFARSADESELFGEAVLEFFTEYAGHNPLLLETASRLHEASLGVAVVYREIAAANDIDELFELYDRRARTNAENSQRTAGSEMREWLKLPPRPEDPCVRET